MGKNLRTLEKMASGTRKFTRNIFGLVGGYFVIPTYLRRISDEFKSKNSGRTEEDIVDDNYYETRGAITLNIGYLSMVSYPVIVAADLISKHIMGRESNMPELLVGLGSTWIATNTASGLYEWFRATKYPRDENRISSHLIESKSIEELADIYYKMGKN